MKLRLLAASVLLLTIGGCVGYYRSPYYGYDPYYYGPYSYYPYRPPAVYADPGWLFFYPNLYLDFSFRGHGGHHYGGHRH